MGISDKGPTLNADFIEKLMREPTIIREGVTLEVKHSPLSDFGGGRPPLCDKCLMRKAIVRFGRRYCEECCPCVQCGNA